MANFPLNIKQGASWNRTIYWQNPDKSPIDTTGMSAKMQIRTYKNGTVLAELSTSNGKITMNNSGVINLRLTSQDTDTLNKDRAVYDLMIMNSDGINVKCLIEGDVIISMRVTKWET